MKAGLLIGLVAAAVITVGFGFPYGLANYYRGINELLAEFNPEVRTKWSFLWGQYSKFGFWDYYLLAQLWKTPIPTLLFFGCALVLAATEAAGLKWLLILLPIVAFHAVGMLNDVNIGIRHVLPVFPFLFLACGAVARWVGTQSMRYRAVFAALCVWYLAGTLRMYPHFIPYFNELVGGPDAGIHYLDDSNIDWSHDFYHLRNYIETAQPAQVKLAAYEVLPARTFGIAFEPMKLKDLVWPQERVTYFVSADYLQRRSFYGENTAVRFHWLERYRPVDKIGWSIFVYRFSTDAADQHDPAVFYVPKEKWYEDAIATLQTIVQYSPNFDEARALLAEASFERAAAGQ